MGSLDAVVEVAAKKRQVGKNDGRIRGSGGM